MKAWRAVVQGLSFAQLGEWPSMAHVSFIDSSYAAAEGDERPAQITLLFAATCPVGLCRHTNMEIGWPFAFSAQVSGACSQLQIIGQL